MLRHRRFCCLSVACAWVATWIVADPPPTPSYSDADLERYAATRPSGSDAGVNPAPVPWGLRRTTPASSAPKPPSGVERTSNDEPQAAGSQAAPTTRRRTGVAVTASEDRDREAAERVSEERYWRREADRVRERTARLEDQASALEAQVAERRQVVRGKRAPAPAVASLEQRARLARERARQLRDVFEDRARREGALPGWIR